MRGIHQWLVDSLSQWAWTSWITIDLGNGWSRAKKMPSHYLIQCWLIVHWTLKIQTFFFKKIHLQMSFTKWLQGTGSTGQCHKCTWKLLLGSMQHTLCGLVTPYWWHTSGSTLPQVMAWCRLWLGDWRHQAITWTNVNLSGKFCSIQIRTISLLVLKVSIIGIWCKSKHFKLTLYLPGDIELTLSPPSAVYMHQSTGSALVQIMACRLFGAKPFPEPMLTYCQLDS